MIFFTTELVVRIISRKHWWHDAVLLGIDTGLNYAQSRLEDENNERARDCRARARSLTMLYNSLAKRSAMRECFRRMDAYRIPSYTSFTRRLNHSYFRNLNASRIVHIPGIKFDLLMSQHASEQIAGYPFLGLTWEGDRTKFKFRRKLNYNQYGFNGPYNYQNRRPPFTDWSEWPEFSKTKKQSSSGFCTIL